MMDITQWSNEDLDKAMTSLQTGDDLWPEEDGGYVDQVYQRLWQKLLEEKESREEEN